MDALVILSGGQDSTTCLYWALQRYENVRTITFRYGQRHASEILAAVEIAEAAGAWYKVVSLDEIRNLGDSSLTDHSKQIKNGSEYPNTFVVGRNLLFLTYAAMYARSIGAEHIIMGVSQEDYSGYPDCREEFIKSAENTINLAMGTGIKILTPLMNKTKKQVWQLAGELGIVDIIKQNTITCYNGIKGKGCGICPACLLRAKGLQEMEKYETNKG